MYVVGDVLKCGTINERKRKIGKRDWQSRRKMV